MWIDVLKSNMLENHLITGQWCKPLTSVREITHNFNRSQGTTSTIHGIWIVSWSWTLAKSPDRRPMMWTCRWMRRTCHYGMQALRYQKGVSRSTSQIMSWSRKEAIGWRRFIMNPTSSTWNRGCNMSVNQDWNRESGMYKLQKDLLLKIWVPWLK